MANRIWKFLNTDIKELCSAEAAEAEVLNDRKRLLKLVQQCIIAEL